MGQLPMSKFEYRTIKEDNKLTNEYNVPGFKLHHLTVEVTDINLVKISGENRQSKFNWSYVIPHEYDPDTIKCTLEDGVLKIMFLMKAPAGTKKIEIKKID